ncbi:ankyrin-3-like [Belonocnema kinseyi]|uniref:ankyrin-3-like n=1 Tax=Belonocnema kinseyi TaxID=2817044 RepID=UPI00143D3EDF|nr:ankyrin-3-like [Belonocnema kinseyi]
MANLETLQELSHAVQSGCINEVKRLTSNLPDNYLTSWDRGFNLLYNALWCNQIEISKLLISRGCPLFGTELKTALHIAVIKGDLLLVQMLLKRGLSFTLSDNEGMTPIYNLAYRFSSDEETSQILDFLVSQGANLNSKHRESGYTLLHFSAFLGNFSIVPLLITKKCHMNARSKEGVTALHVAAMKGYSQIVSELLCAGARPNIRTESSITPLCFAIRSGDMTTIEMLLNRTLRGFRQLKEDEPFIYHAVGTGNKAIVELLLLKGASVNVYSAGKTPLHLAVEMGREDLASILLKSGADPKASQLHASVSELNRITTGYTALHIAAEKEHAGIVNLLLQNGAHSGAADEAGRTPLHLATKTGSLPILAALLMSNRNPISAFTLAEPDGFTPLHIAAENGFEDIVKLFLDVGIPVQLSAKNGWEALHIAVQKQNKALILLLLIYGADVNAAGVNAIETPLFIGAEIGSAEIVEILSEASSTRSSRWIEGYFPLYIAAYRGHKEVVKVLLRKGVDLKANLGKYLSPLHAAAQKGHDKIVDLLLEYGAEVNPKNTEDASGYFSTPILAAVRAGHESIIFTLLNRGAFINVKLHSASQKCSFDVERLLTYGDYTDSELAGKVGYTPLHFAVEAGNETLVQILLSLGANVNVISANSITPLRIAIEKEHAAIVSYLLTAGADIKMRDLILHIAILKKNEEIASMLLKAGVDVNTKSEDNKTALSIALETQQEKLVEYLLKTGADVNIEINDSPILNFALSTKNINISEMILKSGINVNAKSRDGITALSIAVYNSMETIVQPLLEAGANPNVGLYLTPILNIALAKENLKIAEMLIKFGANVNTKSIFGIAPLGIAVDSELPEIVRHLLDAGANVNVIHDNKSVLQNAVSKKNVAITEMLLKAGADANFNRNADYHHDKPAIFTAVETNNKLIVEMLLKHGADVNIIFKNSTPLCLAAEREFEDIVQTLLEAGANTYVMECNSEPVLFTAIRQKNSKIINLLFKHNSPINCISSWRNPNQCIDNFETNYTPLHLAVSESSANIVELLLQKGSFVDFELDDFPLHNAVKRGEKQIVSILIKYGASVNSVCKHGKTPLLHAVEEGFTNIVRLLLMNGASVETQNDNSLLHTALNSGSNIEIIQLLLDCGVDVNATGKYGSAISRLLESEVDDVSESMVIESIIQNINNSSDSRNSFVEDAWEWENLLSSESEVKIEELVKIQPDDLDTNEGTEDKDQTTEDIKNNSSEKIKLLKLFLEYGGDPNTKTAENGNSGLYLATFQEKTAAVELLIQNGADVNSFNNSGFSPLKFVMKNVRFNLNDFEREKKSIFYMQDVNSRRIARLMVQEIARLEALNGGINDQNLSLISFNLLAEFYDHCQKEIEEMRLNKICNWLNFFDILIGNNSKLANYIKNKKIKQVLNSCDCLKQYPLYGKALKARITDAKKRKVLLEMSTKPLKKIFRFEFPNLIVDEIFNYLSNRDLRVLCIACNPTVFLKAETICKNPVKVELFKNFVSE